MSHSFTLCDFLQIKEINPRFYLEKYFFFFSTELRFFFSTMQLTLAACTWHHFLASLESSCCQSVDNLGTHFSSVCLVYS